MFNNAFLDGGLQFIGFIAIGTVIIIYFLFKIIILNETLKNTEKTYDKICKMYNDIRFELACIEDELKKIKKGKK